MSDLEHLEFRALDEGLGIHSSVFKTPRTSQKKISPQIFKEPLPMALPTSSYTFLSFLLDELCILFFFSLLCGIAAWQLGITDFHSWFLFIQKGTVLFFHFLLFMILSLFYFLFFNQFKTPSLGELFTCRVYTDS